MSQPFHLSPDNILRFLQLRTEPASTRDISLGLKLKKTDTRLLQKMLSKLKKRGALVELPGGRYRLPGPKPRPEAAQAEPPGTRQQKALSERDELPGRLILHPDGYGFVVPDLPLPYLDGDLFIPPDAIEDAMHGDRVLAKIQRLGGPPGRQRAEGDRCRQGAGARPLAHGPGAPHLHLEERAGHLDRH